MQPQKERWLLALLVLRPHGALDRRWLSGVLWPESVEARALQYLRRSLSNLRTALGSEVWRLQSPTPRTLRFEGRDVFVDVLEFDRALLRGDRTSLEQAVALYRGPLLEGCYEEWLLPERRARELAYQKVLQTLAQQALAQRDYDDAISLLRRLIEIEPHRESVVRDLMRALAGRGDYAALTQAYRNFCLWLREQMQAQPEAETTALYQLLRAEGREKIRPPVLTPLRSAPARSCLPALPNLFVGRSTEREQVRLLLETTQMLTLTGTGGVGKTRLAITVAAAGMENYKDGVWFVDLAQLEDPERLVQAVAMALQVREEPKRPVLETVVDHLQHRSSLLILDNCEHLVEACSRLVQTLLARCTSLRLLATSRQPLGVVGERTWAVPPLSLPDTIPGWEAQKEAPAILLASEAVQLFVDRATSASPSFRLTRANLPSVDEICRLLDGIPLALELAAAWVRALPVAQIAERLRERLDLLRTRHPGVQPRHQTLRATLDWSYQRLEPEEQALLRRLSVFAGGCTLEAAETIFDLNAERNQLETDDILDRLAALIDKSLILYREQAGEGRYCLLETTRQYAREQLQHSGEEKAIRERHLAFFLTLAETIELELEGLGQRRGLERLETELDNLWAALRYSIESRARLRDDDLSPYLEMGLRLSGALQLFWVMRGHLHDGRAFYEVVLSPVGAELRTRAKAKALNGAGMVASNQGDYQAARASYEQSLGIFREIDAGKGTAAVLGNLGVAARDQGDYDSARTYQQESLAIYQEIGNRRGVAITLHNLGVVAHEQGRYPEARGYYQDSLAIRRDLGDSWGVAASLGNLGNVAREQGDYPASFAYQQESLKIHREIGNRRGIAVALHNLGVAVCDQGDYVTARGYHEESLAIKREIGLQRGVASSLNSLGEIAREQGDCLAARAYYEECLTIQEQIGDRVGIATSFKNLGSVACVQGDYPAARSYFEESLRIRREVGDRRGIASSLEGFARLAAVEGRSVLLSSARLWGAAERIREEIAAPISPREQRAQQVDVVAARAALGTIAFETAWAEGRTMTLEQALECAVCSLPEGMQPGVSRSNVRVS